MPDFVLGMNAEIYQGTAAAALGSLTLITNVKDVTLSMEAAEADVTTRANSGWRGTAATLRTASVEFDMVWQSADASFDAIRLAFLGSTTLEFAILDGDRAVSGVQGLKGTFSVTAFNRNEPLEEAISVSVTIKLTTFDEWVVV